MKNVARLSFAFALVLSGAVPAFAGHSSKMGEAAEQTRSERVHPHNAMDARAYVPEDAPLDVRGYAPNGAPVGIGPDFGIGSQR